jgi:RNA polymerase sigma-70 factor (ECF subfamily)
MNGPTDLASPAARAAVFEKNRRRLFGMAYRMLGVASDAEDLVQETYLRWHQADVSTVRSPEAWLLTVISRMSIDRLRHLSSERAAYTGNWLAEPIASELASDPEAHSEQNDDLSLAFLRLLDRLGPEERAAFLLREVFEQDYSAIAESLEKSEGATRQMVHRAEERVRGDKTRFQVAPETHARLLAEFLQALRHGDQAALLGLLREDVVSIADGGGKVAASPYPLEGAARIAHLLSTLFRKFRSQHPQRIAAINGQPAIVYYMDDGSVQGVTTLETDGSRIIGLYTVVNPDKLTRVAALAP